jgi:hypothetical protein
MASTTAAATSAAEIKSVRTESNGKSNGSTPYGGVSAVPVSAIRVGRDDARGVAIDKIYAIKDGSYVIYRAQDQMMVHFADDAAVANEQRENLAGLAGLRARLALLTGDLGRGQAYYDGQVVQALQFAIEGHPDQAHEILRKTVAEAEGERACRGRIQYLLYGLATAGVFLVILGIGYATVSFAKPANNLWLAAIGGAVGAVLSMSIAIRSRTVALDLDRDANIADGALRILVGIVCAGVLILLMATNIVPSLNAGEGAFTGERATWETILLVGFIAGFLERLLPDILSVQRKKEAAVSP